MSKPIFTPRGLSRQEALEVANKLVDGWTTPVNNQRGYVHDKWQPIDIGAKTEAVLRIAGFLIGPETLRVPLAPLVENSPRAPQIPPPSDQLYGWPLDGSGGPPTANQVLWARQFRLDAANSPDRMIPKTHLDAVDALIEAWEHHQKNQHHPQDCPGPPECS